MKKIKLCICDDISYICDYFQSIFEDEDDISFLGSANNSRQCIKMVEDLSPDILLLDIQLEENDTGIKLLPKLKEIKPDLKVIVLSIHENDDFILRAFKYGISDYLNKTESIESILSTVRNVYAGKPSIRPEILSVVINECNRIEMRQNSMIYMLSLMSKLSVSELEILKSLCEGQTYRKIAAARVVEESTIRSQVNRILKKFNADNVKKLISDLNELNAFEIFKSRN